MAITVGGTSITFNDSTVQSTAFTGGGANVQSFGSSGTYTKPSGAKFVMVELWGAGGGASYFVQGCYPFYYNTGGGGGGGAYSYKMFLAPEVCSTVPVTVGAGGASITALGVSPTPGINGNAGGDTTFGSLLFAGGGGGGKKIGGGYATGSYGGTGGRALQDSAPNRFQESVASCFLLAAPAQYAHIVVPRQNCACSTVASWGIWSGGKGGRGEPNAPCSSKSNLYGSVSLFGGGGGGGSSGSSSPPGVAGNGGLGRVLGSSSPRIQSSFAAPPTTVTAAGGGAPGNYTCFGPSKNGLPFNGGGGGWHSFCGPPIPTTGIGGLAGGGGAPSMGGGNGYAIVYSW